MSANLNGNGMSDEGVGMVKEDDFSADTPSAPGNNSAQGSEPGVHSHLQHEANHLAQRASNL